MITNRVENILRYYGMQNDELVKEAARKIRDVVQEEVLEAVKTAIDVRFFGIPQ